MQTIINGNGLVRVLLFGILVGNAPCLDAHATDVTEITSKLTPQPQHMTLGEGSFNLTVSPVVVQLPVGVEHEGCRNVLAAMLQRANVEIRSATTEGHTFVIGKQDAVPELPTQGQADEGYVLRVTSDGVTAQGASAAGLLYAAQTLRQLARAFAADGQLPALTIVDYPEFRLRGIYIEGGQERYGRIVAKDYLCEQIRQLAEFKMNTLAVECYNLFPYASFPACADQGTLSESDCHEIVAEAKRYHVTIVPSLQTLAQAYELVWQCDEGTPYRESPAPGLMCPSNPDIYPLIKGLYRDLLTRFDNSPIIGIGCSEIDMQWKQQYCPACQRRIEAGETVRDLLLGHAVRCIAAVHEVSAELGRPIRPLMWGDEFYMYGPGKDWVGIDRIPQDTVMGYWKYWPDYAGINALLQRGYDVLGISAMYNHSFYLADLSPADPPKAWPPMEQTGTRNIASLFQAADEARRTSHSGEFWGVATASFSKHRLRAFDSIWYGFALNGHVGWSHPERSLDDYQNSFTRAFVRHYYDVRTDEAADALARVYAGLDRCKSQLELANQTLNDVVGVYDTQEPGYQGNTLVEAFRRVGELTSVEGEPNPALVKIRDAATSVVKDSTELMALIDAQKPHVGRVQALADLWLAGEKIAAHAQRQLLLIDAQSVLKRAQELSPESVRGQVVDEAKRWAVHRERVQRIHDASKSMYSQGDPLGLTLLLGDIATIQTQLRSLAEAKD